MNWAHVHLILNHVPLLGAVFGLLLLLWGLVQRSEVLQRAALVAFVGVALAGIPVYLTGEPAEEIVEHLAGTSEVAVEAHEEFALLAFIGLEVLGLIALAGLVMFRRARSAGLLVRTALLVAVGVAGMMAWTANLGGRVRHAEIRGEATPLDDER